MNNRESPTSPLPPIPPIPWQLVPEFVQEAADADAIATAALQLLADQQSPNSERAVMLQGYERLKALLGKAGASKEVALHVLTSIGAIDGGWDRKRYRGRDIASTTYLWRFMVCMHLAKFEFHHMILNVNASLVLLDPWACMYICGWRSLCVSVDTRRVWMSCIMHM